MSSVHELSHLDLKHHVSCRFASWHHPCCSGGGSIDLRSAGRGDVVPVQEKPGSLSRLPLARQRLLQTDQLSGNRIRWKCSDYRPGGSFRGIAPGTLAIY